MAERASKFVSANLKTDDLFRKSKGFRRKRTDIINMFDVCQNLIITHIPMPHACKSSKNQSIILKLSWSPKLTGKVDK
jgi:hypothetical protein